MKKEEREISVNKSSGAEKVEKIQKTVKKEDQNGGKSVKKTTRTVSKKTETAKGESAMGNPNLNSATKTQKRERVSAKKINTENSGSKAEIESAKAKARVEIALKKKEAQEKKKAERAERLAKKKAEKEKRIAEKKALIEKRKAEKKALVEKRSAQKKALIEKRAKEKEEKLRERAKEKANRKQKRTWSKQKKQEENKQKRQNKKEHDTRKKGENKERAKGYGGWIAAVVTLGVTTLALASTVTVGAIEMSKANNAMTSAYRGTVYELTGIMEHIDNDLDRARIANTAVGQSRILSDLLVQARLAEADIEKLPVSAEADRNLTSFVNRTAKTCEQMLAKLASGEPLSKEDTEKLEKLYQTNHAVRAELDKLTKMTDKDFMQFMKKGKGMFADLMNKLEKLTLEENSISFDKIKEKMEGAGTERTTPEAPKEEKGIDPAKAEELCLNYFAKYDIKEYKCVGETVSKFYNAYNLQGYDDKGTMLFAEISQQDGALLRFDYYEECNTETFDIENAERIAEEFLYGLGYEDMEVVRFRENGTTTDFTFVYEMDGIVYYPDEVHIKVCRSRGVVTGLDATKYLRNHKERKEPAVKIDLQKAKDALSDKLTVESARLAVVQTARGERPAYEFFCSYGEEYYFVFLDACTGQEIAIVNTRAIQ